jgi:nucleoside-diphosphate-sugar epimerase
MYLPRMIRSRPNRLPFRAWEAERIVRAAAKRGLRSMVIRPPVIWGPGDNGPVAQVYRSVAATGAACYVGAGLAAYSNVHSADLARLFSIAIERGEAGGLYHAVAGEIPYRWIAEAVARDLGVPTRSLSMDEASDVFGPFGALLLSACSRSRDPRTRAELGWAPTQHDMLSQIGERRLRALVSPSSNQE